MAVAGYIAIAGKMDRETWRFINTFAPWLAALGTFSAVVVSLYLARTNDRIRLALQAGIRDVARPAGRYVLLRVGVKSKSSENLPQIVWVNITNVGRRSATITHLYWRPVPWRKRGFPLLPPMPASPYASDFPITLVDGKSADYGWPLPEFEKQVPQEFRDEFKGFRGAIRLWWARVCVGTSTGEVFRCKPEKELRELPRKMTAQKP